MVLIALRAMDNYSVTFGSEFPGMSNHTIVTVDTRRPRGFGKLRRGRPSDQRLAVNIFWVITGSAPIATSKRFPDIFMRS